MTQEEQETINQKQTREKWRKGQCVSLSESGSLKWIRNGRKNRRRLTIDDSGRFVPRVLTYFPS